jgi:hypothetical protein
MRPRRFDAGLAEIAAPHMTQQGDKLKPYQYQSKQKNECRKTQPALLPQETFKSRADFDDSMR